eukprot:PLAT8862.1.p1 GENE.PLAT8862.1~~PLAT8862.1.p1  ORF type:complete len:500 (+),score=264.86 PLAT8862.1:89-1588(+)
MSFSEMAMSMAGKAGGADAERAGAAPGSKKVILFDAVKGETHTNSRGFKRFARRLKEEYKVKSNKTDLDLDAIMAANALVLGCPTKMFSAEEFGILRSYMEAGGNLLVFMSEGGEEKAGTNINYFLEQFKIFVNNDAVVRTSYYKYMHPKEVLVSDGILNREIVSSAWRLSGKGKDAGVRDGFSAKGKWGVVKSAKTMGALASDPSSGRKGDAGTPDDDRDHSGLDFVYPYGATLNVQKPAVPVLSSGYVSFPLNRPLAAACESSEGGGRLVVVGSAAFVGDEWLAKEDNERIMGVLIKWLLKEGGVEFDSVDMEDPDLSDYNHLPDTEALSERLKCCLQESDDLPKDFTLLFDDTLFAYDTNIVPEAVALYEQLAIKHEPLTLIPPQFECPQPPLQPAVFPPTLRELPTPALDRYDLDEHFSSEQRRLAQLTNKCSEEDIDYYVEAAGDILGVTHVLPEDKRSGKHILERIFAEIVRFKSSSTSTSMPPPPPGSPIPA